MKLLDLSLTYHWYDEIASGRKKYEYREITPFYMKRLIDNPGTDNYIPQIMFFKHYDAIRFHRGQGSPTTMLVECETIFRGMGDPKLGAPNHEVFIIKLGKIIKQND